ncbi:hypothetical protein ATO12_03550 [Aquimarina atlantica]|uniref:Uncharacterized protein n=1 Tax=Aquimarina atlantica TaxID=1317122 RepID=A0A023C1S1_9FLAO|nr:hypothetical protein [Aquimarina atlantica]EZH75878.1 hypothetical protein ATO12_03550 [Aquimarina atlantica]
MKNKESILELRNRIPVGLTTAQKLLERTKYDIQEAESIWKMNQVNTLAEKISVKPEEASELLQYVKFEFSKALSLHRERNTTDVEKILKSSKKEEQVLANFWLYISKCLGSDVKYGGWINEKGFQQLPELIRDILIIWQWYAYFDYEGVSVEQTITKEVIRILDYKLELNEFAKDLQCLKVIMDKFNQENDKENLQKYIELRNQLKSSEEYVRIDNKIEEMEELVMKKTYQFLYTNSETIDNQIKNTLNNG